MKKDIANKILKYHKDQKFKSLIIIGEHGYGMSAYTMKVISSLYSKD